jgi:DNA modification methylase
MSTQATLPPETPAEAKSGGGVVLQRLVSRQWQNVTMINADCLDVLPIEADAVITDPPYGISHNTNYKERRPSAKSVKRKNLHLYSKKYDSIIGDDVPFNPAIWLKYERVVMWGCNNYHDKLPPGSLLFWDKRADNGHALKSEGEAAWMNQGRMVFYFDHCWHGFARSSENSEHYHPTQKPVALMEWCMEKAKVPAGATVLDPYAGSGSTAIACIRTGRKFIGIEKDPKHYQTACERIDRELSQGVLLPANSVYTKTP